MLGKLKTWLSSHLEDACDDKSHTVEIATAVLLFEVMQADGKLDEKEQNIYASLLSQHFSLSDSELAELRALGKEQATYAVDFHQFTSVINQHCSAEQKREIMDSLWKVAYADSRLSPDEEYTIRKIADLLYVPHSQFIKSKLASKE